MSENFSTFQPLCKGRPKWGHSVWPWQLQSYCCDSCMETYQYVRVFWRESTQLDKPGNDSCIWTYQYVRLVWGESALVDNRDNGSYRAPTAAKLWQLYMNLPVCKDRLRWVRWAWQSWPCRPAGRSGDSFQSASGGRGGCAGPAGESGAQSCTGGCWPACNTRTQLGVGQARRGQGHVFRVAGYNFFLNKSYEKMMAPEEIFRQLSLWMVNFCPLPHIYAIFTCVNPDP